MTASSTPEELQSRLVKAAANDTQRCAVHWVNRLLQEFSHVDRVQFWRIPRGSLHGYTPLQALERGDLRRLQEAAEAFADA